VFLRKHEGFPFLASNWHSDLCATCSAPSTGYFGAGWSRIGTE
jgi:hypothetical protein